MKTDNQLNEARNNLKAKAEHTRSDALNRFILGASRTQSRYEALKIEIGITAGIAILSTTAALVLGLTLIQLTR